MESETTVSSLPTCDICKKADATYDGKTRAGPWAFMCGPCFAIHGIGVGLGKGQKLISSLGVRREVGR